MGEKEYIERLHKQMKYTVCRVNSEKGRGSGTVIYSKPSAKNAEEYATYVLTNHHVVEANIEVKEEWSSLYKRNIKTDVLSEPTVDFFEWEYISWEGTERSLKAEIKAYDRNMDLALLKLKTVHEAPYIATLYPYKSIKKLNSGMATVVCGAALGFPVIHTNGEITRFDVTIDNYPYIMQSAPLIFGNSGGACFLRETAEFIGVPARLSVNMQGFGYDAITHMSYLIPVTSVIEFLKENVYQFLYDPKMTEKECEKLREEKKEEDTRKLFMRTEAKGEKE